MLSVSYETIVIGVFAITSMQEYFFLLNSWLGMHEKQLNSSQTAQPVTHLIHVLVERLKY